MQASQAPNEQRLPRQVLRRSAAIQAHFDARNAETKQVPVVTDAPPATPNAAATTTEAEPRPSETPSASLDPRHADPLYWKQRFQVVEGRLRTREEEHRAAVDGLTLRISELTEQIQVLQANAPAAPTDLGEFLTPEQVDMLGEAEAKTIVETVLKAARKEVKAVVDAELKPLKDAATQQRTNSQESLKANFLGKLTELVPDYEAIDTTDGWRQWLAEEDASTGVIRQEILDRHISKASAVGVARMFETYLGTLTKPPVPPVAPNGSGAGPSGDPRGAPAASTKPTAVEIRDFYKRKSTVRKGQPGFVTEQEALAFEKRLKPAR